MLSGFNDTLYFTSPYRSVTMKRITQKEMTESEQRQLKTLLDQARKAHGRPLTNAENNRIKDDYITELMTEREKLAAKARAERKRLKATPSTTASFNWTASMHPRGRR